MYVCVRATADPSAQEEIGEQHKKKTEKINSNSMIVNIHSAIVTPPPPQRN
jgi:hypothetical protein